MPRQGLLACRQILRRGVRAVVRGQRDGGGTLTSIRATSSGFDELSGALRAAAEQAPEETRKVVEKGAVEIKKEWRRRWTGLAHAPAVGRAVTYDVTASGSTVSAEIGPDKAKRQGALGNLIEFGSINNAPRPGGLPALEAERPRFEDAMGVLAVTLITRNLKES